MNRPEFMQPFDGTKPHISPAEHAAAAEAFRSAVIEALMDFPEHIKDASPQEKSPRLMLVPPSQKDIGQISLVALGTKSLMPGLTSFVAELHSPGPNDTDGKSLYKAYSGRPGVSRTDTPHVRQEKPVTTSPIALADAAAQQRAAHAIERGLGRNGCPVSLQEIEGFKKLLATLVPLED